MVVLVLLFGAVVLCRRQRISSSQATAVVIVPTVVMLVYAVGLLPLYISRFSEYEARTLASFDRYLGIVILTGIICAYFLLKEVIVTCDKRGITAMICSLIFVVWLGHSQIDTWSSLISRQTVEDSIRFRQNYEYISVRLQVICQQEDKIYLVINEDDGEEAAIINFNIRPLEVVDSWNMDDYDAFYDYVAIYRMQPDFVELYGGYFENPADIMENAVYRVCEGKLVLIE